MNIFAENRLPAEWVSKYIKKPDTRMGRYRDNLTTEWLGTGDDSSKGLDIQGMNNTRNA